MFRGKTNKSDFYIRSWRNVGNHGKFDKHAYCYEDVIRTPLLFCKDLNNCENGTKCDTYCNTLDIAQTFLISQELPVRMEQA